MKTSLIIDDETFAAAKKEAIKNGSTVSEVISLWARVGRKSIKQERKAKKEFRPLDLGGPSRIDLNNRKNWMEILDDEKP